MTSLSKLSTGAQVSTPTVTVQQVRDIAQAVLALLPEVSQTLPTMAPGQIMCTPVHPFSVDELNHQWCDIKSAMRETRDSTNWNILTSGTIPVTISYLQVLLRGITMMLPQAPITVDVRDIKALKTLKRTIDQLSDWEPTTSEVNTSRGDWKQKRRRICGSNDQFVPQGKKWDDIIGYTMLTVNFATDVAKFLKADGNPVYWNLAAHECANTLSGLQWCLPPKEKPVIVTCSSSPELSDAESQRQLQQQLNDFQAKWKDITDIIDVDKVEHLRVAISLCQTLAASILAQVATSPVTSHKVHDLCAALKSAVESGVKLTDVTNAAIAKSYDSTLSFTCNGKASKAQLMAQVKFLTMIWPVCVRIAVCFGEQADKDALTAVCTLVGDLTVADISPSSADGRTFTPMFDSADAALREYRAHLEPYGWVNETPMDSCDEEHTAMMFEIACSLHTHYSIKTESLKELIQGVRLDGELIHFPLSHCEYSVDDVVKLCKVKGLKNDRPHNPVKVTKAVFVHALKCLKQVPKVTSPELVKALENMAAYGATL